MHPLRDLLDRLPTDIRKQALTHPAWVDDRSASFERLEFLGDSVLGVSVTQALFEKYPESSEGELSRVRASVVSRQTCAKVARSAGLGDAMLEVCEQLVEQGGRAPFEDLTTSEKVLAAVTESVIGAAFLEFGFDAVCPSVVAAFSDSIMLAMDNRTDAKSGLQEYAQERGRSVTYEVVSVEGPDHDPHFTVRAGIPGISGASELGVGRSKKVAETVAAKSLLERLTASEGKV